MVDEEKLMAKLDELVSKDYGDALMYGCNIAVNAALEGYKKSQNRATIAGILVGIPLGGIILSIGHAVKKCQKRKTENEIES